MSRRAQEHNPSPKKRSYRNRMPRRFTVTCVAMLLAWSAQAQVPVHSLATVTPDAFTVCLQRNGGVASGRRLKGGAGFDYRMSQLVADQMGLPLDVIWIENEFEEENDPLRETYAVLSYRLCDAVPGHPRYVGAVGNAPYDRAALPRWLDMPRELDPETGLLRDRLTGFVDVDPIAVSKGYMRTQIGLAYRDGTPEPGGLDDLGGRSLFVQQGTLSGAIAMLQLGPVDRANVATRNPGAGFLWEVESSGGDLALMNVVAFDTHRQSNPFTALRLADWRHDFGMDLGFAALAENTDLMATIDQALQQIMTDIDLNAVAAEEGLTYSAAASDALKAQVTRATLTGSK